MTKEEKDTEEKSGEVRIFTDKLKNPFVAKDRNEVLDYLIKNGNIEAKTGEPITLTGYGAIGPDGQDDGRRFFLKEDAEAHLRKRQDNNWQI